MPRISTAALIILLALPFFGCAGTQRTEVEAKPEKAQATDSSKSAVENPLPHQTPAHADPKSAASREKFFREILYARATSETPRFDDYTEGSYHVDKLDVFNGLPETAQKEGLKLRGLVVFGPSGLLWAYYIFAFIEEGEQIRVNVLVMPHARITYKATGTITPTQYNDLLNRLLQTNVLATELPPKGDCETCTYPEWHYEVLVSDWTDGKPSVYYGGVDEPKADADAGEFTRALDGIMKSLKETYPLKKQPRQKRKRA